MSHRTAARRARRNRPSAFLIPRDRRRRRGVTPLPADLALHALIRDGQLVEDRGRSYLVARLDPALVETLILASAASEDDEDSDEDQNTGDEEPALGWSAEGSQTALASGLVVAGDEAEPDIGWPDTGSQAPLRLAAGYREGDFREFAIDDEGEPTIGRDDREFDPCDYGEEENYYG